ncbi:hypothetical protein [Ruegeria sp. B32]|uniref:hypothetical protein n=1 Tax=Ruegeria sp. B32 TaxID=2867020 RepID=UPI0021A7BBAD|nr:hypothetical protein [Ruegeria sp. B32]UWR08983.1 hypothetical protein K3752_08550 [Ruegeria sp. B32]
MHDFSERRIFLTGLGFALQAIAIRYQVGSLLFDAFPFQTFSMDLGNRNRRKSAKPNFPAIALEPLPVDPFPA